jgi:hypothetical protein
MATASAGSKPCRGRADHRSGSSHKGKNDRAPTSAHYVFPGTCDHRVKPALGLGLRQAGHLPDESHEIASILGGHTAVT